MKLNLGLDILLVDILLAADYSLVVVDILLETQEEVLSEEDHHNLEVDIAAAVVGTVVDLPSFEQHRSVAENHHLPCSYFYSSSYIRLNTNSMQARYYQL
jgi:hypothetical protein